MSAMAHQIRVMGKRGGTPQEKNHFFVWEVDGSFAVEPFSYQEPKTCFPGEQPDVLITGPQ